MATYQQELELFKNKYKMPKYDLQKTAESVNKLRGANAFLTGDVVANTPANQFIGWVSKTLEIYFKENTQLNENGKYLSSFDAQEFLTDFEDLAEAKYRLEFGDDQAVNRERYAGATLQELNAAFNSICNKINKPLPSLWMEKLKKGSMNIDDLHATTKQAYDSMDKNWNKNENTMAGSLTNVVAGYEAMKQLRDSRKGFFGWFWKLFNWKINAKEDDYFNELSTQVENLKKYFDIDKISSELTSKTVLGIDLNAKQTVTKTQTKDVKQAQADTVKESPVESNAKSSKMKPVAGKIENMFEEIPNETLVELYRKTSGDQPSVNETEQEKAAREQREFNRVYSYKFLLRGLKDRITELNQQFDEAVANGGDPKKEMQKVVNGIFRTTVEIFSMNIVDGSLENSEAFKNATKIIVNNFTASAIYPNEFGEEVNAYINQNVKVYKEIVEAGKEYKTEIENYKQALEEDVVFANDHEPAFVDNNLFSENDVNKSAPVIQQPQINEISLNKNK